GDAERERVVDESGAGHDAPAVRYHGAQRGDASEVREELAAIDRPCCHQRGPLGRCSSKYRVNRLNRCTRVPGPSKMPCDRFGYSIIVNGLLAATGALISCSVL